MRHPKAKLCLSTLFSLSQVMLPPSVTPTFPTSCRRDTQESTPQKSSELRKCNLILKTNINKHQKTELLLHINCQVSVDVHFLSFKIFWEEHKSGIHEYFPNYFFNNSIILYLDSQKSSLGVLFSYNSILSYCIDFISYSYREIIGRVRACVMSALQQSPNAIQDAVCADRWTKACSDTVIKAGFCRPEHSHNCWYRWFQP